MAEKIVIVGGGQAGASCAAKLRKNDAECEILLIGNENILPYQRPPLSKKYATGEMTKDQLLLRPENWYEINAIRHLVDKTVDRIDRANHKIDLSNQTSVSYDKLVIATGSKARQLPEQIGGKLKGVYQLRDIADADQIAAELHEGRRVTIVGGGYIGLEAAAVCASKGLDVTLIEATERILQRVACSQTSDYFRDLHSANGVKLLEDVRLDSLVGTNGKVGAVKLADGTEVPADFVLVGIGILPNMEIASEAGLEVENGILVDAHCRTSDPDIFAAGDCAVFPYNGHQTRLESVQNAIDQAECVADNINGEARPYKPYPWFWSDQYSVKLQIAGLNRGFDRVEIRPGEREGSVSHFYYQGDQMLAVDAMNDPRTYMVAKKMLEADRNIPAEVAADPTSDLKGLLKSG